MEQKLYTTQIIVKLQVDGIHSWPDCPHLDVMFLRHPHRHVFHVTVKSKVSHSDREKEIIIFQNNLREWFEKFYDYSRGAVFFDFKTKSCEMICGDILDNHPEISYVSVLEDNENGAEVYRNEI